MPKYIIIGGVAGGATAAARLRRLDEHSRIIIFERGEHISYANCGLPYYIGGIIADREDLLLQTPESFRKRFNIDVRVNSEVIFIDRNKKTVEVKDTLFGKTYAESYDKLILSPGAKPIIPSVKGLCSERVFSLRDITDADKIKNFIENMNPKSAAIVGGGFIGIEMAENLKAVGLDVSIIEISDHVIPMLDNDIACDVRHHLEQHGISLYLSNRLQSITLQDNRLNIELLNGFINADMLVLATGVRPESQLAKDAGLALNEYGSIITNKQMQTSDPDIFAIGDAVEVMNFVTGHTCMMPLAGSANKQGRIAADNICGIYNEYAGTQGSTIIKVFDMVVASTGICEKTARLYNLNYDKVFLWHTGHASYFPGSRPMSIKTVFEKDSGKILGAQIAGFDGVDKRCDVLAVAIRAGMTAKDLTALELCYSPPYSSAKDPINMVGYVIDNTLTGKVKNYHWHDIKSLPRDGSVTLLDVRYVEEALLAPIEGFRNIPLDSLRGCIKNLDRTKPIYILCYSGARSYIAARILSQNGFDVYNLSGGYRLIRSLNLL